MSVSLYVTEEVSLVSPPNSNRSVIFPTAALSFSLPCYMLTVQAHWFPLVSLSRVMDRVGQNGHRVKISVINYPEQKTNCGEVFCKDFIIRSLQCQSLITPHPPQNSQLSYEELNPVLFLPSWIAVAQLSSFVRICSHLAILLVCDERTMLWKNARDSSSGSWNPFTVEDVLDISICKASENMRVLCYKLTPKLTPDQLWLPRQMHRDKHITNIKFNN